MKWQVESVKDYVTRVYGWHSVMVVFPHRCDNRECRVVVWLEPLLTRLVGGYGGDSRLWACSDECSRVLDQGMW